MVCTQITLTLISVSWQKFIVIYKNKNSRLDCKSYRGISLLAIAGKAFARVVLPQIQKLAERVYPDPES